MAIRHYLISAAYPNKIGMSLGMSTISIKSGRKLTSADILKLRDEFARIRNTDKDQVVILNIVKLRR